MDNGPPFSLTEGAQVCERIAGSIAGGGRGEFSNTALSPVKTKLNYCDLQRFIRCGLLASIEFQTKIVWRYCKVTCFRLKSLSKFYCSLELFEPQINNQNFKTKLKAANERYFMLLSPQCVTVHLVWRWREVPTWWNNCDLFYILLTVHHVMILGKWPTWHTNSFLCIYFYL